MCTSTEKTCEGQETYCIHQENDYWLNFMGMATTMPCNISSKVDWRRSNRFLWEPLFNAIVRFLVLGCQEINSPVLGDLSFVYEDEVHYEYVTYIPILSHELPSLSTQNQQEELAWALETTLVGNSKIVLRHTQSCTRSSILKARSSYRVECEQDTY